MMHGQRNIKLFYNWFFTLVGFKIMAVCDIELCILFIYLIEACCNLVKRAVSNSDYMASKNCRNGVHKYTKNLEQTSKM